MFKDGVASSRTGWQGKEFKKFIIGSTLYCYNNGKLQVEPAVFMDIKGIGVDERLAPRGTIQEWIGAVNQVIMYPRLRFAMYHSMATVLLGPNDSANNEFAVVGETSIGKTFTLMVNASMVGNPNPKGRSLIIPGNTSIAALNSILTTLTDIPAYIDEIGDMKDDAKDSLSYAIGNGKESTRGKSDGTLRLDRMIRTNANITGEVAAISEFAKNGVAARQSMCTLRPIPEIDGRVVTEIKRTINGNYGHILPLVLTKFFELGIVGVRNLYKAALDRLYETTTDAVMQRKADYYALAEVGGLLLESVLRDLGIAREEPSKIVDMMWTECVLGNPDIPVEIKALSAINDWSLANPKNFLIHDQQPLEEHPDAIYGWFVRKVDQFGNRIEGYEFLDLNRQEFEKFLRVSKYDNPTKILKYYRTHGITECSVSNNGEMCEDDKKRLLTYSARHYYQNNQTAVLKSIIRIRVDKITELLQYFTNWIRKSSIPITISNI